METVRQQRMADLYAVLRAQVMNVHQACLTTSERELKRRTAMMRYPVAAWNTHKAMTFDSPNVYDDDSQDIHGLAQDALEMASGFPLYNRTERRVIEIEVAEHSLKLLDKILIQMVEAVYISACRQREKRFGEAVTLSWGVCEQLIQTMWRELLDEANNGEGNEVRMPKAPRRTLTGRDYTASVMIEILEITRKLDHDLYKLLQQARKVRNAWAHDLRAPEELETHSCVTATVKLLEHVRGITLALQPGGTRGGVPLWPVWLLDVARGGTP